MANSKGVTGRKACTMIRAAFCLALFTYLCCSKVTYCGINFLCIFWTRFQACLQQMPLFLFRLSKKVNCLVPRRLSFDENVRAKEGGKETMACRRYPSHGPLRFIMITSHSFRALLCHVKKRSAWGGGWKVNIIVAVEWTTKAFEKKKNPEKKFRLGWESNPDLYIGWTQCSIYWANQASWRANRFDRVAMVREKSSKNENFSR